MFGLLSLAVILGSTGPVDVWTTGYLQNLVPRSWDTGLSVFSLAGSFEVTTILVGVVVWRARKDWRKTAAVIAIYLAGMGIEFWGKTFLYHPNPPVPYHRYQLPFAFPTSGVDTGNSYPSGHSYRTMFLAVLTWPMIKRREYRIGLAVYTAVMLVSRVSLGEHWISDVAGGGLLGAALGKIGTIYPKVKA
ncbi:hypothetical protein A3D85_00225 [Candidatus Amesbacteria bacterium RIFCSPHIGHO2_02_FULL_47_9]|nr:MAG: hypothetical protein A3D85_00225 [Candidatus Amesbacteria bacterium RIFCSPHIGHO2_02_FULL_47_9]OGD07928.1 MAG: hypothetical protein A2899_04950 [Candidatus Amesbacteria bacterium RIFCSPLOWO2_01_FULL_49_25]